MDLFRALVAAVLGTAAMTLSSTTAWGGMRPVLLDWLHHGVYAVATAGGWVLLDVMIGGGG